MFKDEQINEFHNRGWVVEKGLWNADEVSSMRRLLESVFSKCSHLNSDCDFEGANLAFNDGRLHRVAWACALESELLKFGQDRRIVDRVSKLLGSDKMDQLICQAHFQMAGDGNYLPWHQDSENRGAGTPDWADVNGRGSYVQTVTAIDPMNSESGAMKFVADTGQLRPLNLFEKENPEDHFDTSKIVELEMVPGDVAFFGPNTIHSSQPNRSENARTIFINGFAYPGANRKKYPGCGLGVSL